MAEGAPLMTDSTHTIVARETAMAAALRAGTPVGEVMGGAYEHMLKS